jgi:hypothetical protein
LRDGPRGDRGALLGGGTAGEREGRGEREQRGEGAGRGRRERAGSSHETAPTVFIIRIDPIET